MSRLRCPEAFYNSSTVSQRRPCAAGTREIVLDQLNHWAQDASATGVLLLLGRAGYGKTSIAYSFCQHLETERLFGGSFFCSRTAERTTRVSNIIPSICYNLITLVDPLIVATIRRILLEDPDIGLKSSRDQFTKLLLPVAGGLKQSGRHPIIVIEGLDECADDKEVATLVRLLSDSKLELKILLTCRPEQGIRKLVNSLYIRTVNLHDSGTPTVSRDIEIFVREELVQIIDGRSDFDEPDPWPSSSDVSRVADLAHGMFLVASAACDYIGGHGGSIPKRLHEVITAGLTSARVVEPLDRIYRDILKSAFFSLAADELRVARKLLAAIANLFDSLTVTTLDQLLDLPGVRSYLSSFHSILRIGSGKDPLVGIGHNAFREFISDSSRSDQYWQDPQACHEEILVQCFKHFDHLQRTTHATSVHNLPQISVAVGYACRHWASHLSVLKHPAMPTLILLETFAQQHLPIWLACISHLNDLVHVEKILEDAERWAQVSDLLPFFVDARRFTMVHFDRLSSSFRVGYTDAMRWSPTDSFLRKQHHVPPPTILSGLPQNWGPCETSRPTQGVIMSLASSPDGQIMASGSYDGIIQIFDARTLQISRSIQGHDDCICCLEFSNDGLLLLSSSDDSTTNIWDSISLDKIQELSGHADAVLSAVFSSDSGAIFTGSADTSIQRWSSSTGTVEKLFQGHNGSVNAMQLTSNDHLLVSASHDSTIRVWDTSTGDTKILRGHSRSIFDGHTDEINALSFIPHRDHILSASSDRTLRSWDLRLAATEHFAAKHDSIVNSLSFSYDGEMLVSASDDRTVRVWDTRTGQCTGTYPQDSPICSAAFSCDSSVVVSESYSHSIRGWDLTTNKVVVALQGNSSPQWSVATSLDGLSAASGSDNGWIHLYDIGSGHTKHLFRAHQQGINALAFSGDGQHLVSGSYDCTLRIWSTLDGSLQHDLFGHLEYVRDCAFSSTGQAVVSASIDRSVRIWDVVQGSHDILWGHTGGVNSVHVSPNDAWIVSGADDHDVFVWSLPDKSLIRKFTAHDTAINSVRFSPDGAYVAAVSDGMHIGLWATDTWEAVMSEEIPIASHFWSVAFSPDGKYVAACAEDGAVRIWSVGTRTFSHALSVEGVKPYSVWKVAFSGANLVTASNDAVVRVWNVDGTKYTTLPGATLPDGSQLHDGGIKEPLRVEAPVLDIPRAESVYHLSDQGFCILEEEGRVCSEIPSTYRDYVVAKWYGSTLALGYASGLVIIIQCD
ncbi:WD40-repeat-containing domain protein [Mycena epipterygia]|nr:WD40-repeat-containing domain protein [Mycena epipterygia]